MIKITLRISDGKKLIGNYSVSEEGVRISLTELIPMLDQLLRAGGYIYDGQLEINDEME